MADVSKVQGPAGPPESFGKKDKGSVDADKFKEAMHRRVTEVSAADPDEQKKRKRQEEAEGEEDVTEEAPQAPTTPPSQVAPFSLEKEQKKTSPLEMQQGGPGISPTESSQKASLPSPLSTPFPRLLLPMKWPMIQACSKKSRLSKISLLLPSKPLHRR